jgi:hypothetical protein
MAKPTATHNAAAGQETPWKLVKNCPGTAGVVSSSQSCQRAAKGR